MSRISKRFSPEWVEPIGMEFHGHRLHQIPPNGQGIAALIALGILQHVDVAAHAVDSAAAQHLQIEAMKLGFADTYAHVAGERSAMRRSVEEMLDPKYLARRAALSAPKHAQRFGEGHSDRGGTIYLTAADAGGMMVSFIQSNYMGFGSGIVVPQWGLSLQNRGHAFALDPASPNCVAPRKRPFHTIIPGFLTKDGLPQMKLRRDGRQYAAAGTSADAWCACCCTGSSRKRPAMRRAGGSIRVCPSTSRRRCRARPRASCALSLP